MLTEKEIVEIRNLLEKSNNPFYMFDDDGDGVCSYLLLKKHYNKGSGMPIKVPGPLDKHHSIYVMEEKPDLVVILDKALVKQEFIDDINCEVLYIDHHPLQELKKVKYFNPLKNDKETYIPTSYMAYQIVKENIWIAVVGCLFDYKIPDFMEKFSKEYPDLVPKTKKDEGYFLFKTEIGKVVKVFAFNMKGKSSEVKKSIKYLEKINSPYEILKQETEEGIYLFKRYEKLNKEYEHLLEKAKNCADESNLLLFEYEATRTSFTQFLSTELSYMYQDKTIIVAREKNDELKLSLRNQKKNIANVLKKALEGLNGYGGGHEHACGASIKKKDFEILIERIRKLTK